MFNNFKQYISIELIDDNDKILNNDYYLSKLNNDYEEYKIDIEKQPIDLYEYEILFNKLSLLKKFCYTLNVLSKDYFKNLTINIKDIKSISIIYDDNNFIKLNKSSLNLHNIIYQLIYEKDNIKININPFNFNIYDNLGDEIYNIIIDDNDNNNYEFNENAFTEITEEELRYNLEHSVNNENKINNENKKNNEEYYINKINKLEKENKLLKKFIISLLNK